MKKIKYTLTDGNTLELTEKEYYEQYATEEEFLTWYKSLDLTTYEKPSVTVDNCIFSYDKEKDSVRILLIKRKAHPYKDCWALAGGFVNPNEDIDSAVIREVHEEVGITVDKTHIEQLYTVGTPYRDPRTWVITVSYLTFLPTPSTIVAGDDAKEAQWFYVDTTKNQYVLIGEEDGTRIEISTDELDTNNSINKLAFDHENIIRTAMERIIGSLNWKPRVLNILGEEFSYSQVRKVYAKFMGEVTTYRQIDQSNFKKTHGHLFERTTKLNSQGKGRPSILIKLKKIPS